MNSIKKLSEITNFEVIKPTYKEGTEALKALHYEANKIIFKYNRRYINEDIKDKLLKTFSKLGGEIKELEVTDKAKPKKKEILEALREIYKRLYNYKPSTDEEEVEKYAQKTMKYMVSTYLYRKEHSQLKTIKDYIDILDEMKEIVNEWHPQVQPKSFVSLKAELIMKIDTYYDF